MRRAVVLGGTGLIGAPVVRALRAEGFDVTGVGRSASAGRRADSGARWVEADVGRLDAAGWARLVAGAEVVVNAAGALQDGARDSLRAVHVEAVRGLVAALGGSRTRLVQVSAAGVAEDAPTAFFRTKAEGDRIVRGSGLDWVILRPALVIAPEAFGGTALLRGAAALPWIEPRVLPEAMIQTVWVGDVAAAVVRAARGELPPGTVADLAEPEARSLPETARAVRAWLGLPPWRLSLPIPTAVLRIAARGADAMGWLGWRSPLRSTAVATLERGVRGDPARWAALGQPPCRGLPDTLARMPATAQDRLAARLFLVMPLAVGALALFWGLSGVVALARREAAEAVLLSRGAPPALAAATVVGGAILDLALALAVLWRPWARAACLGMALVALGYLAGATLLAPGLWADPLGPLLKVIPGVVLALAAAAMLEER